MLGGSAAAASVGPMPALAPGAALGVSLIEGDLDLSVTGTVTSIDDDRVYAFGHPFYNLGPTQFPLKKAWVYSVFPSLQASWKIAATTEAVGTMDQDRTTAIAGKLGEAPRMIPFEVRLRSARARNAPSAIAWSTTSYSRRCSPTSRWCPCCRVTSGRSAPRRSASGADA